ncbi:MAG: glycosyltransferase family 39 protein [Gemmatimonadetes bacterium]|nr:glycosyltransferase family 39 protein [Gemmatimonadota bacterium]
MTSPKVSSLALALLGLLGTVTIWPNDFVQDDQAILERNDRVHSLSDPARFFTESYWPEPYNPALYRPLASLGYATQWTLGGGSPWTFRVVSIGLLILTAVALYRLARRFVPDPVAWLTAALFIVHPVHVEAVAAGVNQSELMVGLLALLAVHGYLSHREAPKRWFAPRLFGLFLVALMFKESAAMILLLVVAAELLLVGDSSPLRGRLASLRPTLLGMALAVALFAAIRGAALGGNLLGTFVAEALEGQPLGGRALIMLGVVPHWFRLLVWPSHLRADYSPMEIDPAPGWGLPQTAGALVLAAWLLVLAISWRRAPVLAFGMIWAAVTLAPVSNLLVPTGIVLAERTLFVPSVGFMLGLGGTFAIVWDRSGNGRWRGALTAVAATLILLGVARSTSRFTVWRDTETYWRQAMIDAPRSYRARQANAQLLFARGDRAAGEREFRRAAALYPKAWAGYFGHANRLRLAGMCHDAAIFYDRVLIVEPGSAAARAGMIACLLYDARYREASERAAEGARVAASDGQARLFRRFQAIADSAAAAQAPARTVQLTVRPSDSLP